MRKPLILCAALLLWTTCASAGESFHALDRGEAAALADPARHAVPTAVMLWSADCAYCKKNLAMFAGLAKTAPRLRLVTVATEPMEAAVAEPLDRVGATGPRYAYGADAPEALAYALDPKWRGELPRTLLFDGHGGKVVMSGVVAEAAARRALGLAPAEGAGTKPAR